MPKQARESKADRIGEVAAHARKRLDTASAAEFEGFVRTVYDRVPAEDVLARSAESLYGAALGLWKFTEQRDTGAAKVRVYNPNIAEHGWVSPHTIIDVANDDMPFLVDSVGAEIERRGLATHLIVHPTVAIQRDGAGARVKTPGRDSGAPAESLMHIEIDAQSAPELLEAIGAGIEKVLADVRAAVEDWAQMRAKLGESIASLKDSPPPLPAEERDEVTAFLEWIGADHFTFLGFRDYRYGTVKERTVPRLVAGSGLGILREPGVHVLRGRRGLGAFSAAARHFLAIPDAVMIIKADVHATAHRRVHMDYIGIKKYDDQGNAVGERRFIGLFTSAAYNRTPRDIPYLRRKVARTLERAEFNPVGHDGKALLNVLETFPRDELFQISEEDLFETALGIMRLQERPRIRLFVRRDRFERFCSCLVYLPRELYSTRLRERTQGILAAAYDGTISAFFTQLGESNLARLHIIVRTTPEQVPDPDLDRIEALIVQAARSWDDNLRDALIERQGEEAGNRLRDVYRDAFPTAYKEIFSAAEALADIGKIEEVTNAASTLATSMYRPIEAATDSVRFKIYHPTDHVPLSDCLPMFENMGLKVIEERPYRVRRRGEPGVVWMQDFLMVHPTGAAFDPGPIRENFQEAFGRVWHGDAEDDGFNRLVFGARLGWREVSIVRAYCKFLRQARIEFSQPYMEDTLAAHPGITRLLVDLFHARFDPSAAIADREGVLVAAVTAALDSVKSADQDRIIRRYLDVIQASLRTNYFQADADGEPKPYLSIKLDSRALAELPQPRPFAEIFVYSPRVEAVHLRGGKVARGGVRWSDRREDFRTEVLGLMKAQVVKNAVIVPVGAKGGFVAKRPPAGGDREAVIAEGIECYQTMMRGLLDITDNIHGGEITRPTGVVCHDDEDPYLVVAADKGTATFSDIANGIADDYEHWLGDAFASGGSVGYDHKDMGITARGAWESVKRHFRERGVDIQSTDFSVAGVGDMSGDVFGNGMLLSEHIRLVAAFNHLHIFLDPDPDAAVSFTERQRLYDLPRSSWADYDPALISKGGGVFSREAKSVALSPEIKALLGLTRDKMTPDELIRAVLLAPVDLLWFGGIGTYVKKSTERIEDAGDRANDPVRVNAKAIHAKVIGEGANLGLTQLGRIEFAAAGGAINTDAIDNSAGVDCSDHEVNIKIVLNSVVAEGDMTIKQRNQRLVKMTDEVAALVLRNNYVQSQAITVAQAQGLEMLSGAARMMRTLERDGRLDRALQFLPDEQELADRVTDERGLTRPEIAVLLAYGKSDLYDSLLDSDVPEDPYLSGDLARYMPRPLRKDCAEAIRGHRLRREIIATYIANSLVNRAGPTFVSEVAEESGFGAGEIARAYTVTRDVFDLRKVWNAIESLDNRVAAEAQTRMLTASVELVRRATLWFLRNLPQPLDIAATIADYEPGIALLTERMGTMLASFDAEELERRFESLVGDAVPADIARRVAGLDPLAAACHIVHAAQACARPVDEVGAVYFAVGARLGLDWLRAAAQGIDADDHWQRLATTAIVEDLYGQQRALTSRVIAAADGAAGEEAVTTWADRNRAAVQRANDLITEFKSQGRIDIARLAIANRHVRHMIVG